MAGAKIRFIVFSMKVSEYSCCFRCHFVCLLFLFFLRHFQPETQNIFMPFYYFVCCASTNGSTQSIIEFCNFHTFSADRQSSASITRHPSDRRVDPNNSSNASAHAHNSSELIASHSVDADSTTPDAEHEHKDRWVDAGIGFSSFFFPRCDQPDPIVHFNCSTKSKSAPVSVNRSESYKERLSHKRNRNNRRKTSDPSLSSKTKWVDSPRLSFHPRSMWTSRTNVRRGDQGVFIY